MSNNGRIKIKPSHLDLTVFFQAIFPPHPHDVQLLYHVPRHPHYDPVQTIVNDLVFSITPTSGVYSKLSEVSASPLPSGSTTRQFRPKPTCFLHRPFRLDRRAVPRGTLVLSNHKRFDELLTVGWNVTLAKQLGLDVGNAVCIQGYKGDPERRVGLVAGFPQLGTKLLRDVRAAIMGEFGIADLHIGHAAQDRKHNEEHEPTDDADINDDGEAACDSEVTAVAIMNAFGPDEVFRAILAATEANFISDNGGYNKLLYLTGEAKQAGIAALNEKYPGMPAVCVGHRAAEEWGIRYLFEHTRQKWPGLNVHLVLEEEEVPPKRKPEAGEENKEAKLKAGIDQSIV